MRDDDRLFFYVGFYWSDDETDLSSFRNILINIESLPEACEQRELKMNATAYLHYFSDNCDWYVIEKSFEGVVMDSFCYIVLNGDMKNGRFDRMRNFSKECKLDMHFKPSILRDIKPIRTKH